MIEVGNIITLENQEEYLILEDLLKENIKYIYTVKVLEDETPTDEFIIFETIIGDQGEYIKPLEDKDLYDSLIEEFKEKLSDKVIDLVESDKNETE